MQAGWGQRAEISLRGGLTAAVKSVLDETMEQVLADMGEINLWPDYNYLVLLPEW